MSSWLEHTVQVEVEVPIEEVWALWSDLEQMPRWMKWIDSVEILIDNPELSRWKLASGGFQFSWLSRIVKVVPEQIIQWESVDNNYMKEARLRITKRGTRHSSFCANYYRILTGPSSWFSSRFNA